MKNKYDSSSIDTLRFPESVRKSAAMYLGSTDEHGRWLIARELLDNGLDEALAGRNSAVCLVECKDGSYWVLDNGAGIPQGFKTFEVNVNGKVIKNKMPTMQAIFSELHTSGKFRGEAYKTSVGCFTGDTKIIVGGNKVTTFDELYNNWQPISTVTYDIKSDELAYSTLSYIQLSKYTKHLMQITIDGTVIKCTPDHPFYVRSENGIKAVQAKDLKIGSKLVSLDHQHIVQKIQPLTLKEAVPVYGITVDKFHTYFIEPGVLVRNTHGIGAKGTNATSDFFEVYTCFNSKWYSIKFERGLLTQPVKQLAKAPKGPTGKPLKKGTAIHFKPDATIFSGKSDIDLKFAHQWAEITSYLTPGFTVLIVDRKGKQTKYYSKEGPSEYVTKILQQLKADAEQQRFTFKNELCDIVVAFSNAEGLNIRGYTNGLFNSQGGKHVDAVCNAILTALKPFAKKKQVLSAYDVKEGLVGIVNMKLHKAEFSSQDKARLTDLRAGKEFEELLVDQFTKFFKSNKALAMRLCEKASKLGALRSQFKASKKVVQALNQVKRKGMPSKYAPYDARTKVQDRELLIVEGESASGGLREKRKPYQALCPLRGKIQNSMKNGQKALESEEVIMILGALGFDPKLDDPMKKLQVQKVICLADPDPDGPVSGDTLVLTNKGTMRIRDIAALYIEGIDYNDPDRLKIIGYDEQTRQTVHADLHWAGITCRTSIMYSISFNDIEITEDEPYTIDCTASHKWAVVGEDNCIRYVRSDELNIGDCVLSLSGINNEDQATFNSSIRVGVVCAIQVKDTQNYPGSNCGIDDYYCLDVEGVHNFFVLSPYATKFDEETWEPEYPLATSAFLCHNCHINSLLLTLFYKYLPQLFNEGRIFVADVPELYAQYKDNLVMGDTLSEVQDKLQKLKAPKTTSIHHIKGWGEIDASLMDVLAVNPETRKLIQIKPIEHRDTVEFVACMNDDVAFRRKMLNLPE